MWLLYHKQTLPTHCFKFRYTRTASFKCWYSSVCRRIRQSQRNCFCLSVAPSQLILSWGPCHAARVTFSCCMTQRFASLMADKAQDFYVGDQSLHPERLRSLDDFQSRNNDGLLNTSVSLQICSVTTSQIKTKQYKFKNLIFRRQGNSRRL